MSICSTRVSNELGGGQPHAASLAAKVGLVMVIIEGVTVALVMILLRGIWGSIYSNENEVVSNENEVVRYVASTMPILAISCFLDGIQSMLSGIFPKDSFSQSHIYFFSIFCRI